VSGVAEQQSLVGLSYEALRDALIVEGLAPKEAQMRARQSRPTKVTGKPSKLSISNCRHQIRAFAS